VTKLEELVLKELNLEHKRNKNLERNERVFLELMAYDKKKQKTLRRTN
jgi:hypothetical protein